MEKITPKLFWTFMLLTARIAFINIWHGEHNVPKAFFKSKTTFFILGFVNFFLWAPTIVYHFLPK
jgi:hypothetical protein